MIKSKFLLLALPAFLASGVTWSTMTANTPVETTKQYLSDTEITTKVKSDLLANKDIKSLSISVTTNKGVVTLTGNVDTMMQKKMAGRITSHVTGVKSVKNELMMSVKK